MKYIHLFQRENAKQAANLQRLTYQFNQTKQEKDSYFQQIQVLSAEKRDLLLRYFLREIEFHSYKSKTIHNLRFATISVSRAQKKVQPEWDANMGPFTFRTKALTTHLILCEHVRTF